MPFIETPMRRYWWVLIVAFLIAGPGIFLPAGAAVLFASAVLFPLYLLYAIGVWLLNHRPKAQAYQGGQAVPATAQPQPRTPTQEDDYREALRRYFGNCELILRSPLDDTAKSDKLREEQRVLNDRIGQMLE